MGDRALIVGGKDDAEKEKTSPKSQKLTTEGKKDQELHERTSSRRRDVDSKTDSVEEGEICRRLRDSPEDAELLE